MNPDEKSAELSSQKDQLVKNEQPTAAGDASKDAGIIGYGSDQAGAGLMNSSGDATLNQSNVYAPQAFYYRGYEASIGEWDECPQFLTAEGLDIGSAAMYNENPSLVFHTGYGYNPQIPYGPYSPITPPLPSVHADGQLHSPHHFPFSGSPFYQQIPPSMSFSNSPTPVSQPDLTPPNAHQNDGAALGPNSGYPPLQSTFGRDDFPGNADSPGFRATTPGYEGCSPGALWSDLSKPVERHRSPGPFSTLHQQSSGPRGSYGNNAGMASQHQKFSYGYRAGSNSYQRGNLQSGYNEASRYQTGTYAGSEATNQGWPTYDRSRQHSRINSSICGCNGSLELLGEQNRGPRALKPKSQLAPDQSSSMGTRKSSSQTSKVIHNESFNLPDFITDYEAAKFFIIKSYIEDNVHKSIKYGVWASTPNGNRKLDDAYHEAMERQGTCPVFLLFSVNASAQFCGVAEMTGPVNFEKSVDYWQQDKWSGQFPVKWHIIKDVPNSQFRHIVLENNDNKPVTNSRDTQEVKLEQGIEMLKIFQSYENEMSILDDFEFYEEKEKVMIERKARQQANMASFGVSRENDIPNPVTLPSGLIKQMTKSFAQVVRLDSNNKEAPAIRKTTTALAAEAPQISAGSPVHTS